MNFNEQSESIINMRNRTVRLDRGGDYWTGDEKETLKQKFYAGFPPGSNSRYSHHIFASHFMTTFSKMQQ